MMICPGCNKVQLEGSLFCGECGARLITTDRLSTQAIRRFSTDHLIPPRGVTSPLDAPSSDGAMERNIFLHLIEAGSTLHICGRADYTLGRSVDGQPASPDIDLAPYDGYGQGVSRLHASLRWDEEQLVIIDLGSSNGTRVNGHKINPQTEYPLSHGDVLALGKLKLQVFLRK